jgi:Domain of unknown function (DUF6378)
METNKPALTVGPYGGELKVEEPRNIHPPVYFDVKGPEVNMPRAADTIGAGIVSTALTPTEIIEGRGKTHGDWNVQSKFCRKIKAVFSTTPQYNNLNAGQREAVDMIAVKLSRYLCGNPNEPDHMLDIAGYAQLANKSTS